MKTKIVYCLVSDNEDYYYEQLLISLYSLCLYNPNAEVILVVDEKTNDTLVGSRTKVFDYVTDVVMVKAPKGYNKMMSSRYLKTTMCDIIVGDFLFIDTDTVVIGDLSIVDSLQVEIAMSYDSNSPFPIDNTNSIADNFINRNVKIVGWNSLVGNYHYNSGVIYAKDTDVVKALYHKWHEYWCECSNKGIFVDQPALIKANKDLGGLIQRLDDTFNWQIQRHGCVIPSGTKILHYFASNRNDSAFILAESKIHQQIKTKGNIDDFIKDSIKNVDSAFLKVTYVISEDDKKSLTEINSFPLWQIRKSHPHIIRLLNIIALLLKKLR